MNKEQIKTDPKNINWDEDFNKIDWNNIDFLESCFSKCENFLIIKRKDGIPQIGGFKTIIAYKENLRRFLMRLQEPSRGSELWESLDGNQLFDLSFQLARGQSLHFKLEYQEVINE